MQKHYTFTFLVLVCLVLAKAEVYAQATNIRITNTNAENILLGNFDTADFPGGQPIDVSTELAQRLLTDLKADSLKQYLLELNVFGNRNTGSDTLSADFGIGAARRWAKDRFDGFSARSGGRLQVGYLQFDEEICTMSQHRNVLGVLPGVGPKANELVLIEGHVGLGGFDLFKTEEISPGMWSQPVNLG